MRGRTVAAFSLAGALVVVFLFMPLFGLPEIEDPQREKGTGIPCNQTTYMVRRYVSPSPALLGFGAVRFMILNYSMFCGMIGYTPYPHTFYILTLNPSDFSQYIRALASCPDCP